MAGQNVRLVDPLIEEEATGQLCVGPVLADHKNALPNIASQLRRQLAEPCIQSLIRQAAVGNFRLKPRTPQSSPLHRFRFGGEQGVTGGSSRASQLLAVSARGDCAGPPHERKRRAAVALDSFRLLFVVWTRECEKVASVGHADTVANSVYLPHGLGMAADLDDPVLKDRIDGLKAIRDQVPRY